VCIAWMMSRSPDLACFHVKIYISRSYQHIADHRAAIGP
jgi:hypothetical protein